MAQAYSTTMRNGWLDAITTAVGTSGLIKIYNGSRPAYNGAATTLLATLTCSSAFAPSASSGVLTVGTITGDSAADATGTATWARVTTSGGTTVIDCDCGTSGSDINFTSTSFVTGEPINITSFTITAPNA